MSQAILHSAQTYLAALERSCAEPRVTATADELMSSSLPPAPLASETETQAVAGSKRTRSVSLAEAGDDEKEELPVAKRQCPPCTGVLAIVDIQRRHRQLQDSRRLPCGKRRTPLEGKLPVAEMGGLEYQGNPVRAYAKRERGEHPSVTGAVYWNVTVPGDTLFCGWFTAEEVAAEARAFVEAATHDRSSRTLLE